MLMRDFGFNIYKEICQHKENNTTNNEQGGGEKSNKEESNDRSEEKSKTTTTNEGNKDNGNSSTTTTTTSDHGNKEQHDDDSQSQKSEMRKNKSLHNDRENRENQDNRSASKDCKMITVKPELLLSFIYFDVSYCGYIFDKDLEDLFLLLGLNLSRSQVKKCLSKLSTRQAIHYR